MFVPECTVKPDINDSMDDEADPEYNFLAEAEKEEFDVEDFRDDREVRVSSKSTTLILPHPFPLLCGVDVSYEMPPFGAVLRFLP